MKDTASLPSAELPPLPKPVSFEYLHGIYWRPEHVWNGTLAIETRALYTEAQLLDFARAAQQAPAPSVQPPEGYVMVPKEYTPEMAKAALHEFTLPRIWKAMLAAAPATPSQVAPAVQPKIDYRAECWPESPFAEPVASAPTTEGATEDEFTAGVNAAAAMLDKMADDYAAEHSVQDGDTGVWEFGRHGEDYFNTLRELADDIRTIVHGNARATPPASAGEKQQ